MFINTLIIGLVFVTANVASLSVSNECINAFRTSILNAHNTYRSQHRVDALSQSDTISATAQAYANYMAANKIFKHSGNGYGENLALSSAFSLPSVNDCRNYGKIFAKMWYDEVKNYDFNHPGFSMSTGHFTQVVWKGSKQLGCGISVASNYGVYSVCNYNPPGNYQGQYEQNVFPRAFKMTEDA